MELRQTFQVHFSEQVVAQPITAILGKNKTNQKYHTHTYPTADREVWQDFRTASVGRMGGRTHIMWFGMLRGWDSGI